MKYYTVNQVAKALGKTDETVRNLIRTNQIKLPNQTPSKAGYKISDEALKEFLKNSPKYMTTAAASLIASPALPVAMAGIITSIVIGVVTKSKKKVTPERIKEMLQDTIEKNEKIVVKKMKKISSLQAEIKEAEDELTAAEEAVTKYKRALEELDFSEIANEINQSIDQ